MKLSLMKKLSFGFLAAVIGSIFITSLISNFMINSKFNNYLIEQHNITVKNIVGIINDMYDKSNRQFNINSDELTRYAMMQQLFIEVKDTSGKVLYSSGNSYLENNNMMKSMMNSHMMGQSMMGSSGIAAGEYKEDNFTLTSNNINIGTTVIGYLGASYFNSSAITFKATLNHSFILSAIIALAFGLILSLIISRQISKPLFNITKTANKMRDGNLEARLETNSNTTEIDQLSDSMNFLAQTLQQQEMLRKRLTSDMAHEIRTPLTTLKTHIEAMLDGIWEPTPERLQIFHDEVTRLTKLVDNLRNLSKLEQTTSALNKTAFNLSSEIEKIIDNFMPMFEKAGYRLSSEIAPGIEVVLDKDKFNQIMHNLISNSYKYLTPNGAAKVTLKKDDRNITIIVQDNGIGIGEKDLPHIFERFYRSDISRSKDTGGSGIGLTITKALVESQGGKIYAESIPFNKTIFTITFPTERIKGTL